MDGRSNFLKGYADAFGATRWVWKDNAREPSIDAGTMLRQQSGGV